MEMLIKVVYGGKHVLLQTSIMAWRSHGMIHACAQQVLTWRSGAHMMRPERSKWENKIFYLKRHDTRTLHGTRRKAI